MAVKQCLFFEIKSDTNNGDISWVTMSTGNLVWSFISKALNCRSNLNLLSNHIMAINDMPYPSECSVCALFPVRLIGMMVCNAKYNTRTVQNIIRPNRNHKLIWL